MHVADGAPRSGTAGAPGICLKMRIRADCLAEMSHNAARRHAGRHALERNWEDLVAKWVESKNVGGVSEVTLLTPIKKGFIPGEGRTYGERFHQAPTSAHAGLSDADPARTDHHPTTHDQDAPITRRGANIGAEIAPGAHYDTGAIRTWKPAANHPHPPHQFRGRRRMPASKRSAIPSCLDWTAWSKRSSKVPPSPG